MSKLVKKKVVAKVRRSTSASLGVTEIVAGGSKRPRELLLLESKLKDFVEISVNALSKYFSYPVVCAKSVISSIKFSEYFDQYISGDDIMASLVAQGWSGNIFMNISRDLFYALFDIVMGGIEHVGHLSVEDREITAVEKNLVRDVSTMIAGFLERELASVSRVNFLWNELLPKPRLLFSEDLEGFGAVMRLHLEVCNVTGTMDLIIPHKTVSEIGYKFAKFSYSGNDTANQVWFNHMANVTSNVPVNIAVKLESQKMKVDDILSLAVGDILDLDRFEDGPMELSLNGCPVVNVKLGHSKGFVSVKLLSDIGNLK